MMVRRVEHHPPNATATFEHGHALAQEQLDTVIAMPGREDRAHLVAHGMRQRRGRDHHGSHLDPLTVGAGPSVIRAVGTGLPPSRARRRARTKRTAKMMVPAA